MQATGSCRRLVHVNRIARRHNPEKSNFIELNLLIKFYLFLSEDVTCARV
jgi:hypothetical protein